jgi:hypothetical protein
MPARVGGVIPNFFFDAIGRIVPGTYLLVGTLWVGALPSVESLHSEIRSSVTTVLLFLFCLLSIGYLAGFLLAGVSFLLEWAMAKRKMWSLEMLRKRFGDSPLKETKLERVFFERFGFKIIEGNENNIEACSWLCAFHVWAENPHLGSMASRWDAEALADRSLAAASLIIALEITVAAIHAVPHWYCIFWFLDWYHSLWFLLACIIAVIDYDYHRKQRVWGRFQIFASLPSNMTKTARLIVDGI